MKVQPQSFFTVKLRNEHMARGGRQKAEANFIASLPQSTHLEESKAGKNKSNQSTGCGCAGERIPSLALLASCSAAESKQAPKKVTLHWNADLPSTSKKVGWWLGQAVSSQFCQHFTEMSTATG